MLPSARPEMVIFPNLFVGRKKLRTFIFLRKKIIIISGQILGKIVARVRAFSYGAFVFTNALTEDCLLRKQFGKRSSRNDECNLYNPYLAVQTLNLFGTNSFSSRTYSYNPLKYRFLFPVYVKKIIDARSGCPGSWAAASPGSCRGSIGQSFRP